MFLLIIFKAFFVSKIETSNIISRGKQKASLNAKMRLENPLRILDVLNNDWIENLMGNLLLGFINFIIKIAIRQGANKIEAKVKIKNGISKIRFSKVKIAQ